MPKKLKKNKQIQKDCGEMWKEIVGLRDGQRCQVKKLYPEIKIGHSNVYQADHCFTRGNKHLFFEVANGTMVCSSCNMAKHYDNKSVKRAVDEIVKQREGVEKWEEMLACDMSMGPNVNWGKIWWLEEQKERLRNELIVINRRRSKKKELEEKDLPLAEMYNAIEPVQPE